MRVTLPSPTGALLGATLLLAACGAPAPSTDPLSREVRLVRPAPAAREVVSPVERGGGEVVRASAAAARRAARVVRPTAAAKPSRVKSPRTARFVSIVPTPEASPPAPPVVATAPAPAAPTERTSDTPALDAGAPNAGRDGPARDGAAEDGDGPSDPRVPARPTLPGVPGAGGTCLVSPKGRIADALGGLFGRGGWGGGRRGPF